MEEILEELSNDLIAQCLLLEEDLVWLMTKTQVYHDLFFENTKDFDIYSSTNQLFSLLEVYLSEGDNDELITTKLNEFSAENPMFQDVVVRHFAQLQKAKIIEDEIELSFRKYPLGRRNLKYVVSPILIDVDEPNVFEPIVGSFVFAEDTLMQDLFPFINLNNDFEVVSEMIDEDEDSVIYYLVFKDKYDFTLVEII